MLNASKQQAVGKPKGKQVVVHLQPRQPGPKQGQLGLGPQRCPLPFAGLSSQRLAVRGSLLRHAVGIPALQPRRLRGAAHCCPVPAFPSPGSAASWQPA